MQENPGERKPSIPKNYLELHFNDSKLSLSLLLHSGETLNFKKAYFVYSQKNSVWWHKSDVIPAILLSERGLEEVVKKELGVYYRI